MVGAPGVVAVVGWPWVIVLVTSPAPTPSTPLQISGSRGRGPLMAGPPGVVAVVRWTGAGAVVRPPWTIVLVTSPTPTTSTPLQISGSRGRGPFMAGAPGVVAVV